MNPFPSGPYLSSAFICEKVLTEADGVKSAIRIIDRLTHTVSGPDVKDEMEPFPFEATGFIKFKAGRARGSKSLELVLEKPSGESLSPVKADIYFEGEDDRGLDIIMPLTMSIEQPGVHWFDVRLDGEPVTRIPLRVIYSRRVIQTPDAPDSPSQG